MSGLSILDCSIDTVRYDLRFAIFLLPLRYHGDCLGVEKGKIASDLPTSVRDSMEAPYVAKMAVALDVPYLLPDWSSIIYPLELETSSSVDMSPRITISWFPKFAPAGALLGGTFDCGSHPSYMRSVNAPTDSFLLLLG